MRYPATLIAMALLACSCVTHGAGIDYQETGRFAGMHWPESAETDLSPDPTRPITVDFRSLSLQASFNPIPGLESMPFGQSMHGPWDVGQYGAEPELYDFDDKAWARWTLNRPTGGERVSFVRKDFHTAMHYIALQTRLQLIVEASADEEFSFSFWMPQSRRQALDLLRAIAILTDRTCEVDGDFVLLRKRRVTPEPVEPAGEKYNVNFENHGLIDALMITARVTGTQIFVPSQRPEHIPEALISLKMEDATPERIFRELARLGNLEIEEVNMESEEFEFGAYKFRYKE